MSLLLTSRAGSTAWRSFLAVGALLLGNSSLSAQGSFDTNSPVPYYCYAPQTRFLDGKLYTISGFATSSCAAWDPATNAWTMLASFPGSLRQYAGVATWNGKLYIVGGDTGGGGWTNTLYCYTVASNSWTTLAPMPGGARYNLSADAVNGKIYAIGGTNGSFLNRVEEYDIASNTWSTKAPMPLAKGGPMSAVIDGQIYVLAGSSGDLQIYNPSTNSWSIGPSMPAGYQPSNNHSGDRVAGKLIGTIMDNNTLAVRLVSYDPATSTWTLLPFLPSNRWANGFAVNPNTGLAHIVSGWTGGSYSNLHSAYKLPPAPPIADGGADQTVSEGEFVALDGSASSAEGGNPLSYAWAQVAGPAVTLLNAATVTPSFSAPAVLFGGATLTFELVVNDGFSASAPDTVDISVKNVNNPPIAFAGDDQTVVEDALVMLDGSGSADVDNDPLTFNWVQLAGTAVMLVDADTASPGFVAPFVGQLGELLSFQLLVSDGIDYNLAYVDVLVENVNHPPIANAGADQTRAEGSEIVLDGSASGDPDLDPISFSWIQVGGPTVALANAGSAAPGFTAPLVTLAGATLVFQLVVNDSLDNSPPDTVSIQILDVNAAPLCEAAVASQPLLWPPNHKLIPIQILGVSDPENDAIVITVTSVTQDEPVAGLGQGDTGPDAVLQGSAVLIRAERSGTGNGRVYRIHFTATDGQGGSCQGSVTVSVPHNQGKNGGAVDSGQNYISN